MIRNGYIKEVVSTTNDLDVHSRDTRLKSRPEHQLYWGRFIVDFRNTSTDVVSIFLKLDQESFLPHLFQILNRSILLPFDFIILAKDIVTKQTLINYLIRISRWSTQLKIRDIPFISTHFLRPFNALRCIDQSQVHYYINKTNKCTYTSYILSSLNKTLRTPTCFGLIDHLQGVYSVPR
jgi:hypothetical protein